MGGQIRRKGDLSMSENNNKTGQAAPAKPKRPKAKSMIMLGEQTAALAENTRLAKERGEKNRLVYLYFSRRKFRRHWGCISNTRRMLGPGVAARKQADPYLQMAEGAFGV